MIYDVASKYSLKPTDLFKCVYRTLINREKGPRLAGFLKSIGKEKTVEILSRGYNGSNNNRKRKRLYPGTKS